MHWASWLDLLVVPQNITNLNSINSMAQSSQKIYSSNDLMEIQAQKVDQAYSLSYNKGTNLQCSAQRNGYYSLQRWGLCPFYVLCKNDEINVPDLVEIQSNLWINYVTALWYNVIVSWALFPVVRMVLRHLDHFKLDHWKTRPLHIWTKKLDHL